MRITLLIIALGGLLFACADAEEEPVETGATTLVFTIENIAPAGSLGGADVLYAPGVWAAHTGQGPLYRPGEPASAGLEALAEDGQTSPMVEDVRAGEGVVVAGTFGKVEVGVSDDENPISPGTSAGFQFRATPGQRLSLATMFIQSNDVFLGTKTEGIELFDGGEPRLGTHEAELTLWDAGTEINEPPGEGPNQAPRQAAPNTGPDENGDVSALDGDSDSDGNVYPNAAATVRFTIALEEVP